MEVSRFIFALYPALSLRIVFTNSLDKQRADNRFTKGMFGIGHKIYFNNNTYLKSSIATAYSKVHGIVDQVDKDFNYHRMADVKSSSFAQKLGFQSINGSNYTVLVENLIDYFQD